MLLDGIPEELSQDTRLDAVMAMLPSGGMGVMRRTSWKSKMIMAQATICNACAGVGIWLCSCEWPSEGTTSRFLGYAVPT